MTSVKITFKKIKSPLREIVENKADDYDYSGGFDSNDLLIQEIEENLEISFVSEKSFNLNFDYEDEDYEEDLSFTLLGRGQFFSSLYFEDPDYFDQADINVQIEENNYHVKMSKDPSFEEK